MSKNKSITEQNEYLQCENLRLNKLSKIFDKVIKNEFGFDKKGLHTLLTKKQKSCFEFEEKIRTYFNLNSAKDMSDFISIMCSENNLNYFNNKRANNTVPASMQG